MTTITIGPGQTVGHQTTGTASPGTIDNFGTIQDTRTIGAAAYIGDGGIFTNEAGALVTGNHTGVSIEHGFGQVSNSGTIQAVGGGATGTAVYMDSGGALTNYSSGVIYTNANDGVFIKGGLGTLDNRGMIQAQDTNGPAVNIVSGGSVINTGSIAAMRTGVAIEAGGSLDNSGSISSTGVSVGSGVYVAAGGQITNHSGAQISADRAAVFFGNTLGTSAAAMVTNLAGATLTGDKGVNVNTLDTGNNTVVNAGAIVGTGGTAVSFGSGNDLLVVNPGATFSGIVDGGTGNNTIELAAGGELNGLGTQFVNFGTVALDAGSAWKLDVTNPGSFSGTITGFGATDTIDLVGQAADGVSYQNGVLQVTEGSQPVASFTVPGNFNSYSFRLTSDNNGGADVTLNDIAVFDTTTQQSIPASGQPYSGPVKGLQQQYIYSGSDNVAISVSDDNWFLHAGPGEDAIQAHGGYNVLDGGTGSNFLTGGSGTDTFFVDDRNPSADIWSTANNFHQGDDATVFGITSAANVQWFDNQGAAGYTGLTMHVADANQTASLTLPGYSASDLNNGRLSVQFGSEPDSTPFMHIIAQG